MVELNDILTYTAVGCVGVSVVIGLLVLLQTLDFKGSMQIINLSGTILFFYLIYLIVFD